MATKKQNKVTKDERPDGLKGKALIEAWRVARKGELFNGAKITKLVTANPKKAGSASAARFDLYHDRMTVAQAIKAGLRADDIWWDQIAGFISLNPNATDAKPAKPTKSKAKAKRAAQEAPAAP